MSKRTKRTAQAFLWIALLTLCGFAAVMLMQANRPPDQVAKRVDEATRTRLLAKYEPSMAMLREAARSKGWQG